MSENPNLKPEYRSGCLIFRLQGRDILERKAETFQAIASAIKARPVKATLVDFRAVPGPITFLDRYQIGENAGRYLAQHNLAALMLEEQADPGRIGQQVARNRGAKAEVFTDPTEADAWLKKHAGPA